MAVYLGSHRISPSLHTVVEKVKTITKDTNNNIISQTQTQTIGGTALIEDPNNLSGERDVWDEWTRPSGWPNLDNITIPADFEGVYLTYDNTSKVAYKWACIRCTMNTGNFTVAVGHMNGNNWVQDSTANYASNAYAEINYGSSSYDYVVLKVVPASTNHIQQFYFGRIAAATVGTIVAQPQYSQHCLERRGMLPYLTTTTGSADDYRYCTEWMEYDNTLIGSKSVVTSLAAAWYRARSLQKINFTGWNTTNWNVTTLSSTFSGCTSIKKIDLSSWDTTNWHVTTIDYMFSTCAAMRQCIVPFNTVNWGATSNRAFNLAAAWNAAESLEELDLRSWDVSALNVTGISQAWYYCVNLRSLKVDTWDTTNWTITADDGLSGVWAYCRRLTDIDLSGWNTANWRPKRIDSLFFHNNSRYHFHDIENWNTTIWAVQQANDCFGSCYKVTELNLNNWNTTNWACTSLSNMFGSMYSVRHIYVNNWVTTNWKVTNFNYLFANDFQLEEITIGNWNTSNWVCTSGMYQMFYSCYNLKEIDLSNWVTTKFALTATGGDMRYFAAYCYNVRKIDISNISLNPDTTLTYYAGSTAGTNSQSPFWACYKLEELKLPSNYHGHIWLDQNFSMQRPALLQVLNNLSNAVSGQSPKCVLGTLRHQLTTADVAIATGKGYTVS